MLRGEANEKDAETHLKRSIECQSGKTSEVLALWGRDGLPVRSPDSQSREPGFKSHSRGF